MIARQFVLSSSSFFSDTLPSQHSSFSTLFELDGLYHRAHRSQHPSLPTLFVLNTLRARWFVPSSSSFSTLIALNTHRFQHSSFSTLFELYGLYHRAHRSQHSSLPTLFSTLFVINTLRARWFVPSSSSLQYSPSGTTASLSTLQHAPHSTNFGLQHSSSSMVCTIELILLNTLRLVPRPNFRFCNTPPHSTSTKFQRYSFDGLIAVWMCKHPPSILDPRRCGDMFGFG